VTDPRLDRLVDVVLSNVRSQLRRLEDRGVNRRRELMAAAEEHAAALESAARELGAIRGRAAETSVEEAAKAELTEVVDGAFERLAERFLRRVQLEVEKLPDTDRYGEALGTWARQAARRFEGPVDVFTSPRDRQPVFEALMAAGAEDFQVHIERRITCGFVVRDPDGRTVVDRRAPAMVAERKDELLGLLRESAPPPPGG